MRLHARLHGNRRQIAICGLMLLMMAAASAPSARAGAGGAPFPFVQAISPVSVAPGSNSFTLTVTGANFVPTSAVFWGSSQLATTYVSSTKLTATVSAAMIETSGTGWITVVTPGNVCNPGGGTSNVMYLPVVGTVPSLTFVESQNDGAPGAWGVIAADFNKDGMLDVVTANRGSNTVTVYLGNGNGTFQAGQQITVFTGPFGLAVGDINHDGNLDLIVTSLFASGSGGVAVLLGNGDGTFQSPTLFTTDHGQSLAAALADVNGDGNLDLIAGNATGGVAVFLGNGNGTFQAPVIYGSSLGQIGGIRIADLNGDGKLDLIVANEAVVAVLLGNGDGTFQTAVSISVPGSIDTVIGDFDGDGKLDAVASSFDSATVFLKGNGDGTFQTGVTIATSANRGIQIGDFNGDGKLDFVTQDQTGQKLDFYIGNGDGTFQAVQSFGTDLGPQFTFAVGNFATGGGLAVAAAGTSNHMVFFQTAVVVSPAVVNFGSLAIGSTSDPMTVTVTNSTPAIVNISSVTISETGSSVDFHQMSTTCAETLAVGASCTVQVTFQPTVAGPLSASVEVTDDAPGSPQSATLSGTGTAAPVATFSTTTVTFAAQGVGTQSAAQMVTLTNTGTAVLNIEGISITGANAGDFTQTDDCVASMAVSAVCTFNVKFTPAAAGARSASITIDDDAPGNPHSIALMGTGQVQPTATAIGKHAHVRCYRFRHVQRVADGDGDKQRRNGPRDYEHRTGRHEPRRFHRDKHLRLVSCCERELHDHRDVQADGGRRASCSGDADGQCGRQPAKHRTQRNRRRFHAQRHNADADNFARRNSQHSGGCDAARRIYGAHHFDLHGRAGALDVQCRAEFIHGYCDADKCRCVACNARADVCAATLFNATSAGEATGCVSSGPLRLACGAPFNGGAEEQHFLRMDAQRAVRNGAGRCDYARRVRVGWLRQHERRGPGECEPYDYRDIGRDLAWRPDHGDCAVGQRQSP